MFRLQRYIAAIALILVTSSSSFSDEPQGGTYGTISNDQAMDCVIEFVDNREKYSSYGCLMEFESTYVNQSSTKSMQRWAVIFEDSKSKNSRTDSHKIVVRSSDASELPMEFPMLTTFRRDARSRVFFGRNELTPEEIKGEGSLHIVPDPWMACISEPYLLDLGLGGKTDYWSSVFDSSKQLWSESNSKFIRSEWRFGKGEGECNIQVYFALNEKLPVFVRYILPKDKNEKFASEGRFVSENQIEWKKLGKGFVPIKLRGHRETSYVTKKGLKSVISSDVSFRWKTTFHDEKGVNPKVFSPGEVLYDDIVGSFPLEKSPNKR